MASDAIRNPAARRSEDRAMKLCGCTRVAALMKLGKSSLDKAVEALADMDMAHLASSSPEEQERRITAMERRVAKARRGTSSTRAAHFRFRLWPFPSNS